MTGYIGSQDADLTSAGYGTANVVTTDPQRLMDGSGLTYTCSADGEAVTQLGIGGGSSTGGSFNVAVFDISASPKTLVGFELITQTAASNAWKDVTLGTPLSLINGHIYAVEWGCPSNAKIAIKSSSDSGHNHPTLNGTSNPPSNWTDGGATFGSKFAVRAKVEAVNPSITSVNSGNALVNGQSGYAVVGQNLSTANAAQITCTNASETQSLTITGVSGTGFTLSTAIDVYGSNLAFTDDNHSHSLVALHDATSLATKAISVNPDAGHTCYVVTEAAANRTDGNSCIAGLPTIPSYSQVVLPDSYLDENLQSQTITPETVGGAWTGILSFPTSIPVAGTVIPAKYRPGDGSWQDLNIVIAGFDETQISIRNAIRNAITTAVYGALS